MRHSAILLHCIHKNRIRSTKSKWILYFSRNHSYNRKYNNYNILSPGKTSALACCREYLPANKTNITQAEEGII